MTGLTAPKDSKRARVYRAYLFDPPSRQFHFGVMSVTALSLISGVIHKLAFSEDTLDLGPFVVTQSMRQRKPNFCQEPHYTTLFSGYPCSNRP